MQRINTYLSLTFMKRLTFLTLMLISSSSFAANSHFRIHTHGNSACEYLNQGQYDEYYKSYFDGYISAYNRYGNGTGDLIGSNYSAGFAGEVKKYCRENPSDAVLKGMDYAIKKMKK